MARSGLRAWLAGCDVWPACWPRPVAGWPEEAGPLPELAQQRGARASFPDSASPSTRSLMFVPPRLGLGPGPGAALGRLPLGARYAVTAVRPRSSSR